MDTLLPKNGEDFTSQSFINEDIGQLAEIEFDPEVNGALAGRASLLRVLKGEHRGGRELAIIIGRPFWGSRLGRKVTEILIKATFDELNTNAIISKDHPENHASIALLQAFNFCQYDIFNEPDENWQQGHFIYC